MSLINLTVARSGSAAGTRFKQWINQTAESTVTLHKSSVALNDVSVFYFTQKTWLKTTASLNMTVFT